MKDILLEFLQELYGSDIKSYKEFKTHIEMETKNIPLTISKHLLTDKVIDYVLTKDLYLRLVKLKASCVVDILGKDFKLIDSVFGDNIDKIVLDMGASIFKGVIKNAE